MIVRRAGLGDVAEMIGLMLRCHEEAAFRLPATNLAKCSDIFEFCVKHGCALVAEHKGRVIGAILGKDAPLWFTDEVLAMEVFTYVIPEKRDTGAGMALYRAFRRRAKSLKLKVLFANSCGLENDRMANLFEKMGLKKIGSQFIEV